MNYPILWWIHVITHLSQSIEHRTVRAHPSVNCELQVMVTCGCELIVVNRGPTLGWGVGGGGSCAYMGQGEYGGIYTLCSVFLFSALNSKFCLKKKMQKETNMLNVILKESPPHLLIYYRSFTTPPSSPAPQVVPGSRGLQTQTFSSGPLCAQDPQSRLSVRRRVGCPSSEAGAKKGLCSCWWAGLWGCWCLRI